MNDYSSTKSRKLNLSDTWWKTTFDLQHVYRLWQLKNGFQVIIAIQLVSPANCIGYYTHHLYPSAPWPWPQPHCPYQQNLCSSSLFFSTSNGTSSFWAMPWPSAQYHWLHPFNSFIKAASLNSLPKPKTFGAYTCNIPWSLVSPTKKATHFPFHQPLLLHHLLHPQALLLQQDS